MITIEQLRNEYIKLSCELDEARNMQSNAIAYQRQSAVDITDDDIRQGEEEIEALEKQVATLKSSIEKIELEQSHKNMEKFANVIYPIIHHGPGWITVTTQKDWHKLIVHEDQWIYFYQSFSRPGVEHSRNFKTEGEAMSKWTQYTNNGIPFQDLYDMDMHNVDERKFSP